jgi:hypothetical protein
MDLLDLMDAVQVHAAAAAVTAGGAKFYDVAVGFPAAKGKCVRIFYGGERETEHFAEGSTLTSKLVAQAIGVRGYWPVAGTATSEHRATEGEMAAFVKSFRTRILGDSQLGGESVDLGMTLAVTDQVLLTGIQYAVVDMEIVCDFDEFTRDK